MGGQGTDMHELQQRFANINGEEAWETDLRALFETGDLDAAHSVLEGAHADLDTDLAQECLAIAADSVQIAGWAELVEAIAMHEGGPITGVTLAVANEADRAFEKGRLHHPYMMLGLYTDEPFRFSDADAAGLLAEMRSEEGPAWAGWDEDIEVHLDIHGLDRLNTALLHHKQRHFFRDEAQSTAPARYVEYVLGCWWRALLFQHAVTSECAIHGLPGGIPVIAGMVDMRPEIVMVHGLGARAVERERRDDIKPASPMLAANFIQVRPVEEERELSGVDLRRRVAETGQEDQPASRRGLLARIFGR